MMTRFLVNRISVDTRFYPGNRGRSFFWIFFLNLRLVLILCVSAHFFIQTNIANADVIYVNCYATGPGDGSESNSYYSLKTAVEAAAAGDVIRLKQGIYYERMTISKPLKIEAPDGPAHIGQFFVGRFRVLTQNIYGQSTDCGERATKLGEKIANAAPAYDIIGVQEYFDNLIHPSCDPDYLYDAITSTGRYLNSNNTYLFNPDGEFLDGEADGGIGVFTLHPIMEKNEWEWDTDATVREHGIVFARIRIPGTPLAIDTYVVHLHSNSDDCEQPCRQDELEQLANTISENSRYSGNPVLIMGDFNIGGPPPEEPGEDPPGNPGYDDIMSILINPRDLWLEAHPDADGSSGYTNGCDIYGSVSESCDGDKRIDYIFVPTHSNLMNSSYEIIITNPDDVRRVKFSWNTFSPSIRHYVSDHFGVEATIEIREQGAPSTTQVATGFRDMTNSDRSEQSGNTSNDEYQHQNSEDHSGHLEKSETKVPAEFGLSQNYPNPFNPETIISYQLPVSGHTTLRIYNLLGSEVIFLRDEFTDAGFHQARWNGRDRYGQRVTSGFYLYRLEVNAPGGRQFVATRKMNLLQ